MPSFAIISEGVTDQAVLENILRGYFKGMLKDDDELVVNPVQPKPKAKKNDPNPSGGWTLVFLSLRDGDHRKALQFNDYVILQIDTDVSNDPGFGVPHQTAEGPLPPEQLIELVKARLVQEMDNEFYSENAAKIVFAIAVHSLECWLLPLLYDSEPVHQSKIAGCLEAANDKLNRMKKPPLLKGKDKNPISYANASEGYKKRALLLKHQAANPSLKVFIDNLAALGIAQKNTLTG